MAPHLLFAGAKVQTFFLTRKYFAKKVYIFNTYLGFYFFLLIFPILHLIYISRTTGRQNLHDPTPLMSDVGSRPRSDIRHAGQNTSLATKPFAFPFITAGAIVMSVSFVNS